jgi:DNA-binding CsgD family transcriptional regulator
MANTTITPKQKEVLGLLGQGKTVDQIAKKLKITNSGVYGHIRRMKEAKIDVPSTPSAAPARASAPKPYPAAAAASNGSSVESDLDIDVEGTVRRAIEQGRARLASISDEIAAHEESVSDLRNTQAGMAREIEHYDAALAALTGK